MKHISELLRNVSQKESMLLKSGHDFIDQEIGGYHSGELTTICGVEDSGKTAFIISQIDRFAVEQHVPTLIALGLMDIKMFVASMIAYHYDIETNNLWGLWDDPHYQDDICEYDSMLREAPLFIVEENFEDENWVKEMKDFIIDNGIKIAFFDEYESFTLRDTSLELKQLAMQSNIPIIKTELVWRDRDGGDHPISLADINVKEHHVISSMSDTVIAFIDYGFIKIYQDERGVSLRDVLGVDILKKKGVIEKQSYRLFKKRLYFRTRYSDSRYDVPESRPIANHI